MNPAASSTHTRKKLLRQLLKILGRILLPIFARVTITGKENFPKIGPVILAGNHVAFMEVVLMVVYPPYVVELIGTGDIPLDPTFAPLAHLYGFIPINRGNVDRTGLNQGLSVLKQGGVLGIFPEGGIWQPDQMQTQTGVSWLSSQAHAPIVPIGFGGMRGAISAILHLKRPHLTMNIGEPIPPIQIVKANVSRKSALVEGAHQIMERIQALIPAEEKNKRKTFTNQRYDLVISILGPGGTEVSFPADCEIYHRQPLAQFLLQPVLLDVFVHNLKLVEVRPLQNLNQPYPAGEVKRAVEAVLNYLAVNRGFLTYRFGMETGLKMQSGLLELMHFAAWAEKSNIILQVTPVHYFTDGEGSEKIERGSQRAEIH